MIFFAITPSGYMSASRKFMMNVQSNRSVLLDHLDVNTGDLVYRRPMADISSACRLVRIIEGSK